MKFISLIILFALLNWTWGLTTSTRTLDQNVHVNIQEDVKNLITDYIRENLPNSQNLRFERLWTEKMKDSQIKASFIYSFEDENATIGAARVSIEGYALLNRKADEADQTQVWSLDDLYIMNNHVEFKDGIRVSPSGSTEEPAPEEEE